MQSPKTLEGKLVFGFATLEPLEDRGHRKMALVPGVEVVIAASS